MRSFKKLKRHRKEYIFSPMRNISLFCNKYKLCHESFLKIFKNYCDHKGKNVPLDNIRIWLPDNPKHKWNEVTRVKTILVSFMGLYIIRRKQFNEYMREKFPDSDKKYSPEFLREIKEEWINKHFY